VWRPATEVGAAEELDDLALRPVSIVLRRFRPDEAAVAAVAADAQIDAGVGGEHRITE